MFNPLMMSYSRVPFALYHDPEIYERERELIFGGKAWCYLGLEAEIPNKGDFKTSFAGVPPPVAASSMTACSRLVPCAFSNARSYTTQRPSGEMRGSETRSSAARSL